MHELRGFLVAHARNEVRAVTGRAVRPVPAVRVDERDRLQPFLHGAATRTAQISRGSNLAATAGLGPTISVPVPLAQTTFYLPCQMLQRHVLRSGLPFLIAARCGLSE